MSLSARIAMTPSRRLARLATLVPAGGVVVAAATLAARRPGGSVALAVAALAILVALFVTQRVADGRRTQRLEIVLSDDPEIGILATSPAFDGTWRLVDATLAWSGFSMLAIERTGVAAGGRPCFLAAFDTELRFDDRRALARFLRWSMRGGAVDRRRSHDDGRR